MKGVPIVPFPRRDFCDSWRMLLGPVLSDLSSVLVPSRFPALSVFYS